MTVITPFKLTLDLDDEVYVITRTPDGKLSGQNSSAYDGTSEMDHGQCLHMIQTLAHEVQVGDEIRKLYEP